LLPGNHRQLSGLDTVSDLSSFITTQLALRGIQVFGDDNNRPNLTAYCFKGHDNKTASLSIHKATGKFYCFGCGVKGGSWNSLAKRLDLQELGEEDLPDWFEVFHKDISARIKKAMQRFDLPWDLEPWKGKWRHVSQEILDEVEAYKWFDDPLRCYRILLPIYQYGKLRGWTSRRLDKPKEGMPYLKKYRNNPGINVRDILYPLDVVSRMESETVVLVEGPYDALRLINFDIPALAVLGALNFDRSNVMHLLNAGAEKVIIAMDSNEAGEKARANVITMLDPHFEIEHFHPPEKKDPGNMARDPYLLQLWDTTRS
jgi:5S rRNA maturation endonuclease (ribonuclease M5)